MVDMVYSFIVTKTGRGIITPLSNLIKARINPIKTNRRALSLVLNWTEIRVFYYMGLYSTLYVYVGEAEKIINLL